MLSIIASKSTRGRSSGSCVYCACVPGCRPTSFESLGVSELERDRLNRAIEVFDTATPGATSARNMLEHFDEYARGKGVLQTRAIREEGLSVYEAAAVYWGGGYDPTTEQITEGPIVIYVPTALAASEALHRAIYAAGKAVDAHRGD